MRLGDKISFLISKLCPHLSSQRNSSLYPFPGRDLVEDAPDVLPGLVAGPVEEGVLQPVRPGGRPPLANVGQVLAFRVRVAMKLPMVVN